jgi:hypothetical protein
VSRVIEQDVLDNLVLERAPAGREALRELLAESTG